MWVGAVVALLASACLARAVTVLRLQVPFSQQQDLIINSSIEYIVEFVPSGDESAWPSRVWVRSEGGDTTRPLLVTARRRTGAQTWQLPYWMGDDGAGGGAGAVGHLLSELERTLCPDDDVDVIDSPDCAGDEGGAAARGQLSLHMTSACAGGVRVSVRATALRDWELPFDAPLEVLTTQAAPRVLRYGWSAGQSSVRLVAESEDDVCATVAVQNYTCPIPETLVEVSSAAGRGLRMTMERSGGVHLKRSQFPRGFLVVSLVRDTDEACGGAPEPDSTWLWDAVLQPGAEEGGAPHQPPPRVKSITYTVKPALSRAQYAVAATTITALFLAFYVAFLALVCAQRYEPFGRLVAPQAVLRDSARGEAGDGDAVVTQMDAGVGADGEPAHRRRRGSDATFDSSDNSDTDSEEEAEGHERASTGAASPATGVTAVTAGTTPASTLSTPEPVTGDDAPPAPLDNGTQVQVRTEGDTSAAVSATPFGLPARLRVAALSRRRARTLRARSDRYLYTLATVAVFYALPVVQFVVAFQIILNVSGSLDLCYYNFLCAHPTGALSDFNHVFSNLGYLLLGALFLLQLRRRRARRHRHPKNEEYGIPAHYGLLASLGAGMMVVALLSGSYHVCPNQLNFQFDTAFMYVLAVLSMVKIYQARHPDVNARAHATFGVLAVLIALVVWGVLGGGALFWGVFTVLHIFTFLMISLRIYYVGQFRLDKQWLTETTRGIRDLPKGGRPLYSARLVLLVIANAVNWAFALYGLFTMAADFAGHLLSVLLCNTLMYMVFYLAMKLLHGERLRWYAWAFLAGGAAAWAPALYFFVSGSSDWSATPARSRHINHECLLLSFYDSHDLWHMLSAVALYLSFNAMLTWDDGLSAVKRTEIAVF